jgi:glycosyltransferase involved in cell wall biosynthesis
MRETHTATDWLANELSIRLPISFEPLHMMHFESSSPKRPAILILAYYYPPSDASAAARPFRLAKSLTKMGYDLKVVAKGDQDTEVGNVVYLSDSAKTLLTKILDFIEVRLLRNRLSLVWGWNAIRYLRKKSSLRYDIVHSLFPRYGGQITAFWTQKFKAAVWIADFQDPIDLPEDTATPSRGRALRSLIARVQEWFVVRHADAVIANTPAAADWLRARYVRSKDKIYVVPNGFDRDTCPVAAEIPERTYRVISHTGDLYSFRHPGKLLESSKRLVAAQRLAPESLQVELIGDSVPHWDGLASKSEGLLRLPWVKYLPTRVPRAAAEKSASEADYLLLLDVQGHLAPYFMPAKIYDYVTIGRPILGFVERGAPSEGLLHRAGIPHVVVYYSDTDAETDRKILEFLTLPNEPSRFSPWFEGEHGAAALTENIARIYEEVFSVHIQNSRRRG